VEFESSQKTKVFHGDNSFFEPDWGFRDLRAPTPGLVVEVARCQSSRDVRQKAEKMILKSNFGVTTVLCFDLGHGKDLTSRVSIYRGQELPATSDPSKLKLKVVCDLEPLVCCRSVICCSSTNQALVGVLGM
jgi:hypothetical protein